MLFVCLLFTPGVPSLCASTLYMRNLPGWLETRLAQNTLNYLNIASITLTNKIMMIIMMIIVVMIITIIIIIIIIVIIIMIIIIPVVPGTVGEERDVQVDAEEVAEEVGPLCVYVQYVLCRCICECIHICIHICLSLRSSMPRPDGSDETRLPLMSLHKFNVHSGIFTN